MRKKVVIFTSIGILFFGLLAVVYIGNYNSEAKLVSISAKIDSVENLDELDDQSELIFKGVKIKGDTSITNIGTDDNPYEDFQTNSRIEIQEIYKDKGSELSVGDIITLEEPAAYKRNYLSGKLTYQTYEDYDLMKNDEEYILFVRKSLSNPENYLLISHNLGKYSLNPDEIKLFDDTTGDFYQQLQKEVFAKYLNK